MSEPGTEGVDDVQAVACGRAVREVITASVVHRDAARADELVDEHLRTHGWGLLGAASAFIAWHTVGEASPQVAEDRFHYLLTRIGNLLDLLAEVHDVDPGVIVLELTELLKQEAAADGDAQVGNAYLATRTCLVAHRFVRLGRSPWGIQQSLDLAGMLAVNEILAEVLMAVVASFPEGSQRDVFAELLREARHILSCQATARNLTLPCLIEEYFTELAAQECAAHSM